MSEKDSKEGRVKKVNTISSFSKSLVRVETQTVKLKCVPQVEALDKAMAPIDVRTDFVYSDEPHDFEVQKVYTMRDSATGEEVSWAVCPIHNLPCKVHVNPPGTLNSST